MPVSKNRSKKSSKRKKEAVSDEHQEIVFMKNPLSNLPRDLLLEGLISFGAKQKIEFSDQLDKTISLIKSIDPLLTISMLTTYGLMGSIDEKGNIRSGYKGEEFNQSHVELIQALFLQIFSSDCSSKFPHPEKIQELFDLLPDLGRAFGSMRYVQLQEERSDEERAVLMIQEELRLHTQSVRNWGYLSKVESIAKRLCAPIDEEFVAALGISATSLIKLFSHLIRRQEFLINAHVLKFAPVFQQASVAEMVAAYYEAHSEIQSDRAIEFFESKGIALEQAKSILLSHSDLRLKDIHTFDAAELAIETKIDEFSIESALNLLSIKFGDLSEKNAEHFFLTNPVWTKPVIKLEDRKYFCAMPQVFFSFLFQIIAELLEHNELLLRQYEKRRADFLEIEIKEIFERSFPGCEIYMGYQWKEDSREYENDLMVRVDSHLILVEAKSHSVSWPALRGAPNRVRRHVKDMLLDPSIQSLRLENRVYRALEKRGDAEQILPKFPVALEKVRTVLRLSVTLEDFATLQTTIHHAKGANWVPKEHPIAPCVSLADLEIVFDILKSTPHKIHYLKRRADLENNLDYKGDEIDLLGFYLKTGFNIGDAEYSGDSFALVTMSEPIDRYYAALEESVVRVKPEPIITNWWKDICTRIEDRNFHQWSDIAIVLLGISFEDQKSISAGFKKISKNVQKNWRVKGHNCAVVVIPPRRKKDALAVVAIKERDWENRRTKIESIAAQIFEDSHVERCLVIAINIDRAHYPYSLISVFFRGEIEVNGR